MDCRNMALPSLVGDQVLISIESRVDDLHRAATSPPFSQLLGEMSSGWGDSLIGVGALSNLALFTGFRTRPRLWLHVDSQGHLRIIRITRRGAGVRVGRRPNETLPDETMVVQS